MGLMEQPSECRSEEFSVFPSAVGMNCMCMEDCGVSNIEIGILACGCRMLSELHVRTAVPVPACRLLSSSVPNGRHGGEKCLYNLV